MRRAIAAVLAIPALQAAYAMALRYTLRRLARRLMAGDVDAFLRFYADDAEGNRVYENHAMIFLKARWGKVVYEETFEDTERTAAFDAYLEAQPRVATPA